MNSYFLLYRMYGVYVPTYIWTVRPDKEEHVFYFTFFSFLHPLIFCFAFSPQAALIAAATQLAQQLRVPKKDWKFFLPNKIKLFWTFSLETLTSFFLTWN